MHKFFVTLCKTDPSSLAQEMFLAATGYRFLAENDNSVAYVLMASQSEVEKALSGQSDPQI